QLVDPDVMAVVEVRLFADARQRPDRPGVVARRQQPVTLWRDNAHQVEERRLVEVRAQLAHHRERLAPLRLGRQLIDPHSPSTATNSILWIPVPPLLWEKGL